MTLWHACLSEHGAKIVLPVCNGTFRLPIARLPKDVMGIHVRNAEQFLGDVRRNRDRDINPGLGARGYDARDSLPSVVLNLARSGRPHP